MHRRLPLLCGLLTTRLWNAHAFTPLVTRVPLGIPTLTTTTVMASSTTTTASGTDNRRLDRYEGDRHVENVLFVECGT
jgi:hypothetical protein